MIFILTYKRRYHNQAAQDGWVGGIPREDGKRERVPCAIYWIDGTVILSLIMFLPTYYLTDIYHSLFQTKGLIL